MSITKFPPPGNPARRTLNSRAPFTPFPVGLQEAAGAASKTAAGALTTRHAILLTLVIALTLLAAACGREQRMAGTAGVTVSTGAPPAQTSADPAATATIMATATPVATATASSTPAPTATPSPVALAAPDERIADLNALLPTAGNRWELLPSTDPIAALESGRAHVALIPGEDGVPAGHEPIVLAVPLTTEWEEATLSQAQEILNNGHPLVTVLRWPALTPEMKPLRVDGAHPLDAAYPLQQPWSLTTATGYQEAAEELGELLRAHSLADETVHLAAVGDVMLDRALGAAIDNGNVDYPFANVATLLQSADIAAANLECALGDEGQPVNKSYTFRAPPAAAPSLAHAGFDVVTLANNHALDYGPQALLQGIALLQAEGIKTVGAGQNAAAARAPALLTVKDVTLAFLGYVNVPVEGSPPYFNTESWTATETEPGLAWANPDQIREDVTAARQQADHVIVFLHSGYEYVPAPSEPQTTAARAAIDAGANLVIGHHAHILQGVEFHESGTIVYGLGNFAFTITGPPETAILNVWLDRDGVRQIEFTPAIVGADGQPRLAQGEEAAAIRRNVYFLTTLLNPTGP